MKIIIIISIFFITNGNGYGQSYYITPKYSEFKYKGQYLKMLHNKTYQYGDSVVFNKTKDTAYIHHAVYTTSVSDKKDYTIFKWYRTSLRVTSIISSDTIYTNTLYFDSVTHKRNKLKK